MTIPFPVVQGLNAFADGIAVLMARGLAWWLLAAVLVVLGACWVVRRYG